MTTEAPSTLDLLAERERRERAKAIARLGPAGFAEQLTGGRYRRPAHLELLSRKLAEVAAGKRKRLLIEEPPRHGKSEMCSHWFPAWFESVFPGRRVILASYEADFAATWGRKVRNTLTEHAEFLPVRLAGDSTAANRWDTTSGGGMVTAGVGGAILGKGADLLIVDDPVKNAEEADSPVHREKVWEWWNTTALTRLEPGASVVLIMHRWHEDDLAGRILREAKKTGEAWEEVRFPAIAEEHDALGRRPGEPLWPERYPLEELEAIKRRDARTWNALYQQRPAPAQGAMFRRLWWRFWRRRSDPEVPGFEDRTVVLPDHFNEVVLSWDLSFKGATGSDPVAGGAWGCHGAERYLLDLVWDRMDFPGTVAAVRAQAKRYPQALAVLIEDAANGPAVVSSLRGQISGVIAIKPEGSKQARAAATTPQLEAGQVYLPLHAEWRDRYIEEHAAFPAGAHDDAVDQQSQALNWLKARGYSQPKDAPAEGSEDWEAEMEQELADEAQRKDREGGEW